MRTLFILCLFLLSGHFYAQSQTEQRVYEDVFRNLQERAKPDFNWLEYLSQNLNYPDSALKNNIQGKVSVEFIVERDGSISQSRIVRGKEIGYGIPEEALRLVNNMPKWKPGRQENQPVRSYFTLPISFSLPADSDESAIHPGFGVPIPSKPASKAQSGTEIYRSTDISPKPDFNLIEFLNKNLRYPEAAKENEVQGQVNVQFVVEKDGNLTDIKIVKGIGIGYGIPEEALRVVKAMPKWKPAVKSGQVVRAYFTMPVSFKLQ